MLASLDPYSVYMPPRSLQEARVQTRGEFGGLGIEVTQENGLVTVASPIDDPPAQKDGLLPGDLSTHLAGPPVMGKPNGRAQVRTTHLNPHLVFSLQHDK